MMILSERDTNAPRSFLAAAADDKLVYPRASHAILIGAFACPVR